MPAMVHAHRILDLLQALGGAIDVDELRERVVRKYPAGAFHNCAGRQFDFDSALAFLNAKGRVSLEGHIVRFLGEGDCCGAGG